MAIKRHNIEEVLFQENQAVTSAIQAGWGAFIVPFTGFVRAIKAKVAVAGTGSANLFTINVLKNGANLFGNATPLVFATSATEATYDPSIAGLIPVAKGDVIELSTTVIYSGGTVLQPVAPVVAIEFCKKPPMGGCLAGELSPQDN